MRFKSSAQRATVMAKLRSEGKVKTLRARDFGDNPHIRGGRERSSYHKEEPWERAYRRQKRKHKR